MQTAVLVHNETDIRDLIKQYANKVDLIIINESQFCEEHHINELEDITIDFNVPVYAYGLKTDFQSHLFEGSKRLIEVADEIRHLEKSCEYCDNAAEINARLDQKGRVVAKGNIVEFISNDRYKSICYKCWKNLITKSQQDKRK